MLRPKIIKSTTKKSTQAGDTPISSLAQSAIPKLNDDKRGREEGILDLSFGPEKRVKQRKSFIEIQSRGRKFKTRSMLFCFLKAQYRVDSSVEDHRLGITITTKVHKRAVRRNKTKRLVREIYRTRYSDLKKRGDLVVILLLGGVDRTHAELSEEFDVALRKLEIV